MRIEDLDPDVRLASLLDGKVMVETSETEKHTIKCYAANRRPQTELDDEFISILVNGPVKSKTQDMGPFKGSLALTIYCKLLDDGTVKTNRIRQIIGQCARLTQGRLIGGFIFRIDPEQVITPTTTNMAEGYATKAIGVEWRTV